MIFSLFRKSPNTLTINRLHGDIVAAARQPAFYQYFGVADTFEGRLELLILHAGLVLRHLTALPEPAPALARDLADAIFAGLEANLREMGVGDIVIPKRMGKLAEAFFGRNMAYDRALKGEGEVLASVLARNVLAGQGDGTRLARYVLAATAALAPCGLTALLAQPLPFPDAALAD